MEQNNQKRVYTLYRVSTIGQVEKDDIPMQKEYCHAFIEEKGWTLVREFSEKGVSGFKVSANDRDAIMEIRKDAVAGKFDILLVFMFDRLGRRDDETPFVVEWFVNQGIEVWSAKEGQRTFETHVDKLLNYITFWQASGESIKTSIRTKTRIGQLTEEGLYTGGHYPYGYKLVKNGRVNKRNREVFDLAVDEEEAAVVRLIFEKYVTEGFGTLRLSHFLQENGYHARGGKDFTNTTLNRIVKNVMYIGIIKNGESRSACIEELRIIDDELFAQAQKISQGRIQPHREFPMNMKAHALLAGRVYCAHCGNRLTLTTSSHKCKNPDGSEGRVTRYRYQCHYGVRHPADCGGQTVYTVDRLDSIMDQVIRDIFSQIKTVPEKDLISAQHQKDIDLARAKAEKSLEAVKTAQKDHDDLKAETIKVIRGESKLDAELLTTLVHEAKDKVTAAQAAYDKANEELNELIAGAQNLHDEYHRILSWADLYDKCSFDAKKMIVCQFIKAVHVSRGYQLSVDLNVSFEALRSFSMQEPIPVVPTVLPTAI